MISVVTAALLLVLCSGLTHAIWNLFTKRSLNKSVFLWSIHIAATVLLLPYFIYELFHMEITGSFLLLVFFSMSFQGGYFIFLSRAYSYGDMSQVYPIMRGTGAFFVPVMSVLVFGESLSPIGWIGLCCIVGGLFAISGFFGKREIRENKERSIASKAVLSALAVGFCITGYTLLDKQLVQNMSPFALIEISNISYVIFSTFAVMKSKQIKQEWQVNWRTIMIGTFLAPGSYVLFLFAMKLAPLASIAPIREVGTVFGTLLGVFLLKEQNGLLRVIMSSVITIGIISIALMG